MDIAKPACAALTILIVLAAGPLALGGSCCEAGPASDATPACPSCAEKDALVATSPGCCGAGVVPATAHEQCACCVAPATDQAIASGLTLTDEWEQSLLFAVQSLGLWPSVSDDASFETVSLIPPLAPPARVLFCCWLN